MNTMSFSHDDAPNSGERIAVLVAHGGTLFAWFLAPLLVYLIKRTDSRWVAYQALQSLLWSLFGTLIALATCGVAIPVFLIWHLYAAWTVSTGRDYEYPVVGDLARTLLA
jgi:uncharacterized Tic20 family protein